LDELLDMLLTIRHQTRYRYDGAGSLAVQRLRLTPTDNPAQTVQSWAIEAPGMDSAASYTDGLGNVVHLISQAEPDEELVVTASGQVTTTDTGGVLGSLNEIANPAIFLRETALTESSAEIEAMAEAVRLSDPLEMVHTLMAAITEQVAYVTDSSHAGTSAAEAFAAGTGVCQDHAHIFIAACRRHAIPARYVTGYMHVAGADQTVAHHAWAEANLANLGWVGFDPANQRCPTEHYVRLACGFDAPSAAPIVGTRRDSGRERLDVDVVVQQQQ
jgi:transglutaminase-like putative cysteine protease